MQHDLLLKTVADLYYYSPDYKTMAGVSVRPSACRVPRPTRERNGYAVGKTKIGVMEVHHRGNS